MCVCVCVCVCVRVCVCSCVCVYVCVFFFCAVHKTAARLLPTANDMDVCCMVMIDLYHNVMLQCSHRPGMMQSRKRVLPVDVSYANPAYRNPHAVSQYKRVKHNPVPSKVIHVRYGNMSYFILNVFLQISPFCLLYWIWYWFTASRARVCVFSKPSLSSIVLMLLYTIVFCVLLCDVFVACVSVCNVVSSGVPRGLPEAELIAVATPFGKVVKTLICILTNTQP